MDRYETRMIYGLAIGFLVRLTLRRGPQATGHRGRLPRQTKPKNDTNAICFLRTRTFKSDACRLAAPCCGCLRPLPAAARPPPYIP